MIENPNEKQNPLFIPSNVKTRSEIFDGYGKEEVIQTLIASVVFLVIALIVFTFTQSVSFVVIFVLVGIGTTIMCVTKDKKNMSLIDYFKNMIAFSREQQDYEYEYLNEWGDF